MRYNYFVPSGYHDFVQKCFKVLRSGEPGVVLFAPKMDRPRRISQLIQDYQQEYPLVKIDLAPGHTSDLDDILYSVEQQLGKAPKKDTGICITNCELIIYEHNYSVIEEMVKLQQSMPHYRFLLFFEIDITHPEIARLFSLTYVFSNIVYYPLCEHDNALSFINYCLNEWKFELKENLKEKIIQQCGGHFWLIRQVIRALRDDPATLLEEVFESDQMRFRLEQIYNFFADSEKSVLHKVIKGQQIDDPTEKHSLNYLQKMGFIENENITIPVLTKYIREHLPKISMVVTDKNILLNGVNVESHFSKKEKRALKSLLEHKGHVVTRDMIAKALWPINTEDYYSDWAVDRLIARLRVKLGKLGMPKEIIKTLRNKGYMLIT